MFGTTPAPPSRSRHESMLSDWGIFDESLDFFALGASAALTSQRIFRESIGLNAGDLVGNIAIMISVAGAGTAPTLVKFGLCDKSEVMLALTANVAADTKLTAAGNTIVQFPLTASYAVPTSGMYGLVALANGVFGTTVLTLGVRSFGFTANAIGAGPKRSSNSTTANQTDLPAVASPLTGMSTNPGGNRYWMAAAP